jgi:ribosome biogenesis GTPase / thiamine phosphate phosphatase
MSVDRKKPSSHARSGKGSARTLTGEAGLVVASHGRHIMVERTDGTRLICHPRGKKSEAVVGDRVRWELTQAASDEGVVVGVEPRRNLLYRQDEWRSKSFAANLDQLLMWIAAEPVFSEMQLTRALISAGSAGIPVLIVLNKTDLPQATQALERLDPYSAMGYRVLPVSIKHGTGDALALLKPLMEDKSTLVLGPSGAGKSSLINALLPHAQAQVAEISQALNSGKHTTTASHWYWLDERRQGAVIDSPGFQEFGLHHVAATDLPRWMPDLAGYLGQCRFHNCTHRQEPGCAIVQAVEAGHITAQRLSLYRGLYEELSQPRWG